MTQTTTASPTGYIATDRDETAIYGSGATEAEAIADAVAQSGDDRYTAADYVAVPASAALLEQVELRGGAGRWTSLQGVAVPYCACGTMLGVPCDEALGDDAVVVEVVPEYLRATHTAAGGHVGTWPWNGTQRLTVTRGCAGVLTTQHQDGEETDRPSPWAWVVEAGQ